MKKDISYYDLIKIVHDKAPSYISFLLMLKMSFTNNIIFYVLSYFLRFNSILTLCLDFKLTIKATKESNSISRYLSCCSSYYLMNYFKITNSIYILISLVIFSLFCLRISIYLVTISKIKKKQNLEKITLSKYQIFMDHLVFVLYPFLLEFLIQILYSYIFHEIFLFTKDQSKIINILVTILNIILIIGYNINNYYYLILINRPFSNRDIPVKYNYSKRKFWIIFFMQNVVLIQNIDKYLNTDRQLITFAFCYFGIFSLFFLFLF